ncbi:hypothetical protein GP486_006977 [Trichoglossum hirsutum]|uniref:Uncharacterized protein n=1 Tax=Trichoglossum hirsutum TaxID=265104 RepID=A0A9P8L754_9PEZI|nr:hypothetical protein GP486_006977 [Trichoglossum hirsutum]
MSKPRNPNKAYMATFLGLDKDHFNALQDMLQLFLSKDQSMLRSLGKGNDAKTERERIFGRFIAEDADAAKILQMCRPEDNDRDDEEVKQRRKTRGLSWDYKEDKDLIFKALTVLHSWSVDRYRGVDLTDLSARWAGNIRAFKKKNPITFGAEAPPPPYSPAVVAKPPPSAKPSNPPDADRATTTRLNRVLEDMIALQEGEIEDRNDDIKALKKERDSLREENRGLRRAIDGLLEEIGWLRAQAVSAEERMGRESAVRDRQEIDVLTRGTSDLTDVLDCLRAANI